MSFIEDGYRTGFPTVCPARRKGKVTASMCRYCLLYKVDPRGHWRCDHADYQQAPGVHFCKVCGIELGPFAEANGWQICGGPTGECRYETLEKRKDICNG